MKPIITFFLCLLLSYGIFTNSTIAQSSTSEPDTTKQKWQGSLMYDKKSLDYITRALSAYKNNLNLDIVIPELFTPTPQDELAEEAPQEVEEKIELPEVLDLIIENPIPEGLKGFYLKSILFLSDNNWVVWINETKVTPTSPHPILSITRVTRDYVALLWRNSRINKLSPNWKSNFSAEQSSKKFFSNDKNIVIDKQNYDISFLLRPNQSLNIATATVIEGKNITQNANVNPFFESKKRPSPSENNKPSSLNTKKYESIIDFLKKVISSDQ